MAASASGIRAGRAYVELGTKDSALVAGLRRAQARLRAFADSLVGLGTRLLGVGALLTAPFAAAVRLFTTTGSRLLDLSHKTGVSVEALQEFGYAAEQTGSSIEDVDVAIGKMQKLVAGIDPESKKAKIALAALGFEVDQLAGLSPEEQFRKLAAGIAAIENPSHASAVAQEVFGRSSRGLLQMMRELPALAKDWQALGVGITREDAERADRLGDRLHDLKAAATGVMMVIGAELEPVVTQLVVALKDGVKLVIEWIREHKELVIAAAAAAVAVGLLGGALIAAGLVMKAAAFALGVLTTLLGIGVAWKVISAGLWLAWSAAVLVAKAAVWLLNVALTVMNALIGGVGLVLAITIALVALAAFAAALAVAWAAVGLGLATLRLLFAALRQLGQAAVAGPLAHIGGLFKEWGGILREVIQAMQVDMPLAWELLKTGAKLALSQIKDLWPPFWNFLKEGFSAVWTYVAGMLKVSLFQALKAIEAQTGGWFKVIGGPEEGPEQRKDNLRRNFLATMSNLGAGFRVEDSPETAALREELEALRDKPHRLLGQPPAAADKKPPTDAEAKKAIEKQFSVAGTFNPFAIAGISDDGINRVALASEQTRDILKRMERRRQAALAFV